MLRLLLTCAMPLCSNCGPAAMSPFEEEEQVQGAVASCPVSPNRWQDRGSSPKTGRFAAQLLQTLSIQLHGWFVFCHSFVCPAAIVCECLSLAFTKAY